MNEDHEKAVLSWLEETDFSEVNISILDNVSDSDRSSEHSKHNTDTEQSGDEDVFLQNDIDAVIPGPSQQRKRPSPIDLMKPHMIRRGSIVTLPTNLRQTIGRLTGGSVTPGPVEPQERGRCAFCPKRKNRFTTRICGTCNRKICGDHTQTSTYMCHSCGQDTDSNDE
ncbi:hypothetical protein J6590_087268 [Homalodisca vitripennis]|nr:hypothetical protein J6590_087268 [Homalodisca vitripennis]